MKKLLILVLVVLIAIASSFADDTAQKQKQAAEALKALGLGAPGGEPVKVIGWRDLAKLIPKEMDGMEAGKIEGGTYTFGGNNSNMPDSMKDTYQMMGLANSYSSAQRTFTKELEDGNVQSFTIRLMDSGLARALLAPYMMAVEYDTPDGLLKSTEIAGFPAKMMQEYDDDLEVTSTQYMVLVNDRVLAHFEGNEFFDADKVKSQAESFPFVTLKDMSKSNAAETEAEK